MAVVRVGSYLLSAAAARPPGRMPTSAHHQLAAVACSCCPGQLSSRMPTFGSFRHAGVTSFSGMGSLGGSGMLTPPITPAGAARGLSKTRLFVVVHKVSN